MENEKLIQLIETIQKRKEFKLPDYSELPRIPLYMEQVTNYIKDSLGPVYSNQSNQIITHYMVNNYVKAKIIEPPKDKKYDINHIGYLICISLLKNSANLRNIAALIDMDKYFPGDEEALYSLFKEIQENEMKEEFEMVEKRLSYIRRKYESTINEDEKEKGFYARLANLILRLYVKSEVSKAIADSIMDNVVQEMLPSAVLKENNAVEKKFEEQKMKEEAKKLKSR